MLPAEGGVAGFQVFVRASSEANLVTFFWPSKSTSNNTAYIVPNDYTYLLVLDTRVHAIS